MRWGLDEVYKGGCNGRLGLVGYGGCRCRFKCGNVTGVGVSV